MRSASVTPEDSPRSCAPGMFEEDLRAMAASDASGNLLREAIEERLRQEAYADESEPLTLEEEAELERAKAT